MTRILHFRAPDIWSDSAPWTAMFPLSDAQCLTAELLADIFKSVAGSLEVRAAHTLNGNPHYDGIGPNIPKLELYEIKGN